ncbi:hypothetical protein CP533_4968 [Ophiocordyceps camponoti-saundersi (nom. inval.)]|nr:hypothetical protein CP533_4968 [Ophiocordyceps camponoti-saundersi (nom. inval.)]
MKYPHNQTTITTTTLLLLLLTTLTPLTAATPNLSSTILKIDPSTSTCSTKGECRTASQAASHLLPSFQRHGVECKQEAACLTALILFETDHLRYQHNVFPGRVGQGTANMQMCGFNVEYASSDPELKTCFPDVVPQGAQPSEDQCRRALKCILERDDKSFDTPAWFLKNKCDKPLVRRKLREGGIAGCAAYLKECVGVDGSDSQRAAVNGMAYKAFGVTEATACVPLDEQQQQQQHPKC